MDGGMIPDAGGIYAALAKAQAEMGKAVKDTNNPHFKTKYADLGSVMDACMGALNRNGICVVQPAGEDDRGRYVETTLFHSSGQSLSCRVPLIVQKNDMQGYGSAVTYARRYGLMCMAGIAPEDDDGAAAAKAAPITERPAQPPVTSSIIDQMEEFNARIRRALSDIAKAASVDELGAVWKALNATDLDVAKDAAVQRAKDDRKAALTKAADPLAADGIPY